VYASTWFKQSFSSFALDADERIAFRQPGLRTFFGSALDPEK